MKTLFELLLTKAAGLGTGSVASNNHVQWPEHVLDYLERNFHLLPQDLAGLRYVRRRGSFGKLPTYYIRIYDWARACKDGIVVDRYHDLDNYPKLVLFQGNIFENGAVQFTRVHNSVHN